jgi:hypothetical protein
MLAGSLGQLFFVGGNPERARRFVLGCRRQAGAERLPQLLRAAGERELRFGVVHEHNVAHGGGSGARARQVALDQGDAQAGLRAGQSAGRAHDAGAGNEHIKALRRGRAVSGCAHSGTPRRNGSVASKIRVLSAVT